MRRVSKTTTNANTGVTSRKERATALKKDYIYHLAQDQSLKKLLPKQTSESEPSREEGKLYHREIKYLDPLDREEALRETDPNGDGEKDLGHVEGPPPVKDRHLVIPPRDVGECVYVPPLLIHRCEKAFDGRMSRRPHAGKSDMPENVPDVLQDFSLSIERASLRQIVLSRRADTVVVL